jgi:hypothetical protein
MPALGPVLKKEGRGGEGATLPSTAQKPGAGRRSVEAPRLVPVRSAQTRKGPIEATPLREKKPRGAKKRAADRLLDPTNVLAVGNRAESLTGPLRVPSVVEETVRGKVARRRSSLSAGMSGV